MVTAVAAEAAAAAGDDATGAPAQGGDGAVATVMGRCPDRGLLLLALLLWLCRLPHLPLLAATTKSAAAPARPRLPDGDCMPAPPALVPRMCGPWPKLSPRMLPHDCLLSSPLLALLEERL